MDRVDGNGDGSQLKGFVNECRGRSEGEACAESPFCGSWTVWMGMGHGSRDSLMNAVEGARGRRWDNGTDYGIDGTLDGTMARSLSASVVHK